VYQYRGLISNRRSSCILKKLLSIKIREKTPCDFYILLLETCLNNASLLKYIGLLLAEEPLYFDFITWGNSIISKYQTKYESLSNYKEKMEKLMPQVYDSLKHVKDNKTALPDFTGFGSRNLLHKDIQQEIVSLITTSDNLYLYKIEYVTSVVEYKQDMDFCKSRSFVSGALKLEDDEKKEAIVEEEKVKTMECPEGCVLVELDQKPFVEKDFFKAYNNVLENKKKVIVFNNQTNVVNPVSSLVRYVIFNNSNKEANLTLNIVRKNPSYANEYFPSGPIVTQVSYNSVSTIFAFHKFDPNQPWSEYELEVKNEWSVYSNYPNNSHQSNFSVSVADNRYYAVSSDNLPSDHQDDEEGGGIDSDH